MTRVNRWLRTTFRFASSLLVSSLLLSCAYYGSTSREGVSVRKPPDSMPLRPVTVANVTLHFTGVRLITLPFTPLARFTEEDRGNFAGSLDKTLNAAMKWHQLNGDEVRVHVIIRRHIVGWSSEYNAAFAGFAWCAADPAGNILFQEQFYATDRCGTLCNLGDLKDSVNRAAIKRIATKALAVATGDGGNAQVKFAGTYDTFDAATGSIAGAVRYWRTVRDVRNFDLDWMEMSQPIDWATVFRTGKAQIEP
ncbi:hypothetical protein [Geomonas azotofigens]|uniref:hypothetical protein n=1 Tax=Geomonas azotofigens TaxID=2843196 RepID=UPI001C1091A3|nr:hypothetical protein [Geomonas azotofigens]MBU5611507.1 hypothetical protein [Geomonas azotofigens]